MFAWGKSNHSAAAFFVITKWIYGTWNGISNNIEYTKLMKELWISFRRSNYKEKRVKITLIRYQNMTLHMVIENTFLQRNNKKQRLAYRRLKAYDRQSAPTVSYVRRSNCRILKIELQDPPWNVQTLIKKQLQKKLAKSSLHGSISAHTVTKGTYINKIFIRIFLKKHSQKAFHHYHQDHRNRCTFNLVLLKLLRWSHTMSITIRSYSAICSQSWLVILRGPPSSSLLNHRCHSAAHNVYRFSAGRPTCLTLQILLSAVETIFVLHVTHPKESLIVNVITKGKSKQPPLIALFVTANTFSVALIDEVCLPELDILRTSMMPHNPRHSQLFNMQFSAWDCYSYYFLGKVDVIFNFQIDAIYSWVELERAGIQHHHRFVRIYF